MKGLSRLLLLLPTAILAQPWIPDPRCPGYNDAVRRNLNSPAAPEPESDVPVAAPALRQEQQQRDLFNKDDYDDLPTFQLKLHWEEGFCWQGEYDERVYCMDCETRTCEEGGIMEIQYCSYESEGEDVRDQRLQWIPSTMYPQMGRLKAASGDLCMDRVENKNYKLKKCDFESVRQLLVGFSYTEPFELLPEYDYTRCLNQQHDPRIFEAVELTDCSVARRVNTNRWEVVELEGDIPSDFLAGTDFMVDAQLGDGTTERVCFPSDVTVIEESRGRIPMKDLAVGDSILGPNNKYSRVYTFGHKAPRAKNLPYLTLEVESGSKVSLSDHHMIFLASGKAVAARHIKVGDELQDHSRVINIVKSYKTGAMAPFTTDGKFIVNDHFVVSSYVDVGASHDFVHMILPRVLSSLFIIITSAEEEYDENGLNVWLPSFETAVNVVRFGKLTCTLGVAAWLARRCTKGKYV